MMQVVVLLFGGGDFRGWYSNQLALIDMDMQVTLQERCKKIMILAKKLNCNPLLGISRNG